MKKTVLVLIAALSLSGCHINKPLTKEQVLTLIADALYGVDYSCYTEWLDGPACTIVYHVLNDASAAVQGLQNGWQAAAKAVLEREEQPLPPDSKIRPYIDAVISLL